MYDYITYESPVGELTIAAEGDNITALVLAGQKYIDEHLSGDGRQNKTPALEAAREWLDKYFAGECPDPSDLALDPHGTDFRKKVWKELIAIPYGSTISYGEIAERLGSSARAVGSAVGRNPVSIIIPCHRVIGADGSITGYAGGLDNKKWLLSHEGAI